MQFDGIFVRNEYIWIKLITCKKIKSNMLKRKTMSTKEYNQMKFFEGKLLDQFKNYFYFSKIIFQ